MRKPKYVMIGPIRYDLKWEDNLTVDGERHHGMIEFDESEISLDSARCLATQQITLLHEVLHAIMYESGVDGICGDKTEELIVRALSFQLHQVFRDSPGLLGFFMLEK